MAQRFCGIYMGNVPVVFEGNKSVVSGREPITSRGMAENKPLILETFTVNNSEGMASQLLVKVISDTI